MIFYLVFIYFVLIGLMEVWHKDSAKFISFLKSLSFMFVTLLCFLRSFLLCRHSTSSEPVLTFSSYCIIVYHICGAL